MAELSARARLLRILALVVLTLAVGFALYWVFVGSRHETTDNAYVGADYAAVASQTAGRVAGVTVAETQEVHAGDVLVRLDDADARIALAEAEAQLATAERRVKGYHANEDALAGQVAAREADIRRAEAQITAAESDFDRARTELDRRQALAASGAVSGDELTAAQNQFHQARAALEQARAGLVQARANRTAAIGAKAVNSALIEGQGENPEVAAARARRDSAQLDLDRTVIRAPIDGVVTKKQVFLGQRIGVGVNLMTIVPPTRAFVDANFKENQLRHIKVGQKAVAIADLYGSSVKFHGRVIGVGGGTGAAFATIPAENATGNWIKVVQRLPVRIALDPKEMAEHPLRVGLSMNVDVDVGD